MAEQWETGVIIVRVDLRILSRQGLEQLDHCCLCYRSSFVNMILFRTLPTTKWVLLSWIATAAAAASCFLLRPRSTGAEPHKFLLWRNVHLWIIGLIKIHLINFIIGCIRFSSRFGFLTDNFCCSRSLFWQCTLLSAHGILREYLMSISIHNPSTAVCMFVWYP